MQRLILALAFTLVLFVVADGWVRVCQGVQSLHPTLVSWLSSSCLMGKQNHRYYGQKGGEVAGMLWEGCFH